MRKNEGKITEWMLGISGLDYAISSNGHAYLTLTANLFAALLLNDTFVCSLPPRFWTADPLACGGEGSRHHPPQVRARARAGGCRFCGGLFVCFRRVWGMVEAV